MEHVHIAATAGGAMRAVDQAAAIAGSGLAGDRYARREGYWRNTGVSRDLTLIEAEALEDVSRLLGVRLAPGETRRNVTTRGVRLNELVDRFFLVGDVLCRGTRLCEPCRHLEEITGKALLRPLVRRGGLRADVVSSGAIRVGDPVEQVEPEPGVGVVVVRDGRVLLGRRLSVHGRGTWSTPGGTPDPGEAVRLCALRELREQTGFEARSARVVAETLDAFPESRLVIRTTFVEVDVLADEPTIREPHEVEYFESHVKPLMGGNVEMVGELDFKTKVDLYRGAYATLFPIQWPEPFGLVMIESMATGTPVVATAMGAAPEVIVDGATGYLVRNDIAKLSEATRKVTGLSREACRKHVEDNFTVEIQAKHYEHAMEEVLRRTGRLEAA